MEYDAALPWEAGGCTYHYLGDHGTEDKVTALYAMQSIVLPQAEKTGESFGGWYYDPECTRPAGAAGDSFTPKEDLTLYAGWVELRLQAQDNYSANQGKGAVNLSWSQQDNRGKIYKLYQQREGEAWQQISSAEDIGAGVSVSRSIAYSGGQGSYRVPYTGFYRFTLTGAQGGNFGSFQGGRAVRRRALFTCPKGNCYTMIWEVKTDTMGEAAPRPMAQAAATVCCPRTDRAYC